MTPADNAPEMQKNSDPSTAPLERSGQDSAGKMEADFWPFEGSRPPKLTPEEIESLLQLWDEEDERQAAIGLKEIFEGRGVSSEELFRRLEEVVRDSG
jgi:hypothetical protein